MYIPGGKNISHLWRKSLVIQPEHVLAGLFERLLVGFSHIDRE